MDPSQVIKFVLNLVQWAAMAVAIFGAVQFIKGSRERDADDRTNGLYVILTGVVLYAGAAALQGQALPTL